jgi:hypothetical protein
MVNIIHHCIGTTHGIGDLYNHYDGMPMPSDEHAVTYDMNGLVEFFFPHIALSLGD